MNQRSPRKRAGTFLSILAIVAINAGMYGVPVVAPAAALAAGGNPSANLDQCDNDPAPSPSSDGCKSRATQWVNGNLRASKSVYHEGDSIPDRMTFSNLTLASHALTIEWDTTKSGV